MPWTTFVLEEIEPLLFMLLELSQALDTVPRDSALSPALPTTPTALLLLESTVMPHCVATIWALLLMFRSIPVGASRQMHVGLLRPPPATPLAATVTVVARPLK